MNEEKPYDFGKRTLQFAQQVRAFCRRLPRTVGNRVDVSQLVRASGSVGANYIEANESLGKKDFAMHLRIACKEAKESAYWLQLVNVGNKDGLETERAALVQETRELVAIVGSMLRKTK